MNERELRYTFSQGESLEIEFKRGTINDSDIVDAVVCLANGRGGHLFLGVEDDGTITGTPARHGKDTNPSRLEALIANKTEPAVTVHVEVSSLHDGEVVQIKVPATTAVVSTKDGRYIRRTIDIHGHPQCLPMRPHEVIARAGTAGAHDYSKVPLRDITVADLSLAELDRFRLLARSGGDAALSDLSNIDLVGALGLSGDDTGVAIGAVLLFGPQTLIAERIPSYESSFQDLDGVQVRSHETTRNPLLRTMEQLTDRVQARNPEEEIEVGLLRVGLPRFAPATIRELIANAIVHRDYAQIGPTVVEVNNDALVVSNPGGLPDGVTLSNLLTTPPRPRNPALADAFKRAGLVERTSRGINRVFEAQLAMGRPAPDYSRSTAGSVVARVRSGPADLELAAFIAETRGKGQDFQLEDLLILHEIRQERTVTSSRAAELFQVDQAEARATLNRLVETGLLEIRGKGKGRVYHMAAAIYRQLGERSEYVRTRGFDEIQQEQMVLTYVERHGSVTRQETADLCQLDPSKAGRLLRQLRDEGKLSLVGERRSARYVLPRT